MEELIPGEKFDGLVAAKIRFFMGDEVSDMLGVPTSDSREVFQRVAMRLRGLRHRLTGLEEPRLVTHSLGRALMRAINFRQRNDDRPMFQVPDALWDSSEIDGRGDDDAPAS
jgi:hypothetical protein